jgi:hypothetical protein
MDKATQLQDIDVANMGVLLGVVAAAFVALGVVIYVAADDQSSEIAAAYDVPMRTERMLRKRVVEPTIIDWRG